MGKSYLLTLDPLGMTLFLFYSLFLITGLNILAKKTKVGFPPRAIVALFVYYALVFLVGTFSSLMPDFPDSSLFSGLIVNPEFPRHIGLGVKLSYILSYPFYFLALCRVELFILLQITIFIVSLMFFWKAWQIVLRHHGYKDDTGIEIFIGLSFIYPAFLMFIPVPLREFIAIFAFAVLMYGIVKKYYFSEGYLIMSIGAILLVMVRRQTVVIAILFMVLLIKNKALKYTLLGLGIVVIPLAYAEIMGYTKFSPEYLAIIRNYGYHKYAASGFGYGEAHWHTYWDIIKDIPGLMAQFLLSPLPILYERNPFELLAMFLDVLFVVTIYVGVFLSGFKISKVHLFVFLVSVMFFSIWEFHISSAPRHRMPLVAMLLPVASFGYYRFFTKHKRPV